MQKKKKKSQQVGTDARRLGLRRQSTTRQLCAGPTVWWLTASVCFAVRKLQHTNPPPAGQNCICPSSISSAAVAGNRSLTFLRPRVDVARNVPHHHWSVPRADGSTESTTRVFGSGTKEGRCTERKSLNNWHKILDSFDFLYIFRWIESLFLIRIKRYLEIWNFCLVFFIVTVWYSIECPYKNPFYEQLSWREQLFKRLFSSHKRL